MFGGGASNGGGEKRPNKDVGGPNTVQQPKVDIPEKAPVPPPVPYEEEEEEDEDEKDFGMGQGS